MIDADFVFAMPAIPLALFVAWRAAREIAGGLVWAVRAAAPRRLRPY